MATKTRQIRGEQYDVEQLVDCAIAQVDATTIDTAAATAKLQLLGHQNPSDALVANYARESAILSVLSGKTGANFDRQIGKIDFSTRESAINGVQSYLWRRVHGQRANWSGRK